jgi:glucosamine-6-phosphate deaminase
VTIDKRDLLRWCRVPVDGLVGHPDLKMPLRLCADGAEMGRLMARELADAVRGAAEAAAGFRVIVPCGPRVWYPVFADIVNRERITLSHVSVFHMDETLDWEGKLLPRAHPYSFRGFMEEHFYESVERGLRVPDRQRHWLEPGNVGEIAAMLAEQPAHLAYGGWGQDGHVAYNQARRQPYSPLSLEELGASTARVQENNADTVWALAQRELGGAYQFVPPMSVTLGMREILGARSVRLFSDTGAWKQTALRVALFSEPTPEYPMTLLQEHRDALLTATRETAAHPIALHPEWDLGV